MELWRDLLIDLLDNSGGSAGQEPEHSVTNREETRNKITTDTALMINTPASKV